MTRLVGVLIAVSAAFLVGYMHGELNQLNACAGAFLP